MARHSKRRPHSLSERKLSPVRDSSKQFLRLSTRQDVSIPDLSKPRITLTDKDIVDSWTFEDGMYIQGGVVNDGYIYFLFGVASVQKKILIFNTQNHNLVQLLNLDDVILEEPEDIDFIGKKLIVTVNGSSAYYVINLMEFLMKLK